MAGKDSKKEYDSAEDSEIETQLMEEVEGQSKKRKAPASKKVSMTSEQAKEKISKITGSMLKADAKIQNLEMRTCAAKVQKMKLEGQIMSLKLVIQDNGNTI